MNISPARRSAFEVLWRVEQDGAYSSALLATLDQSLREDDRGLCHELVLGVLRWQLWLDRVIEHFAGRAIGKLDVPVKLALRLGVYQLRFLSRIPPSAAVNESVNLARARGVQSAAGFVNAVLRHAARELAYDPAATIADAQERLAIETSHPEWLIKRWTDSFGLQETTALAKANNEAAPVAFRLTAKAVEGGAEFVIDQLRSAGAQISRSQIAPDSWRVKGATALLHALSETGLIYMQDEGSQMVAHLLGAQPGERVMDVCAAPGSKAMHAGSLAQEAMIVAGDLHDHRLHTLKALARRQGISNLQPVVYDATTRLPFSDASFDRVLVDAPCSGTGTLRHNPEIRWRITEADIADLTQRQTRILANAAMVVRPGGRLIYSTCSIEPEENEQVVASFLNAHSDFSSRNVEGPRGTMTSTGAIRTWPHQQNVDGFFIKGFERKG